MMFHVAAKNVLDSYYCDFMLPFCLSLDLFTLIFHLINLEHYVLNL